MRHRDSYHIVFQEEAALTVAVAILKKCIHSCFHQASWREVDCQCYEISSIISNLCTFFCIQVVNTKPVHRWMSALIKKLYDSNIKISYEFFFGNAWNQT